MKVPWTSRSSARDADWQRVAVYGYGASGRAATAFLRARGVETMVFDRRRRQELEAQALGEDPGVRWYLGSEPEGDVGPLLRGLDGIVVSPGVPSDRPLLAAARQRGIPVIAEVELAFPFLDGTVIGITGSNGKSTTTALTGSILRQAGLEVEICGNIGVPLSSVVDTGSSNRGEKRYFVVELSSFQLETVERFHPRAAALLNLSPDHLDRHRDMEHYRDLKARLFARQDAADLAVLNADDPWVADLALRARRRSFSSARRVEDGCFRDREQVWESEPDGQPRALFAIDALPLPGPHNVENAMAAALLTRRFGVAVDVLEQAVRQFRGLPHRLELVEDLGGVRWYDDSKGTNLGATLRSLDGFADAQLHLILGGRNKGADFRPLRDAVSRKAKRVYLIGEAAAELATVLRGAVPDRDLVRADTLDEAVRLAAEAAADGEVVLLSPACASFDQFRDFADRGEVFKRLVRELDRTRGGGDG